MAINVNAVRDISNGEILLSATSGISLAATGNTLLYTVPAGQTVVVTKAVVRVTAASGVTGAAVAGIGINATNYDNQLPPRTLTGLSAVNDDYLIFTETKQVVAPAASAVYLGVDTAISGGSMTVTVDLFGYFIGSATFVPDQRAWSDDLVGSGPVAVDGTPGFPDDDTPPLISEGDEVFSITIPEGLNGSYLISWSFWVTLATSTAQAAFAIFDTGAGSDALVAYRRTVPSGGSYNYGGSFIHTVSDPGVSRTISLRAYASVSTLYIGARGDGSTRYGAAGLAACNLNIVKVS